MFKGTIIEFTGKSREDVVACLLGACNLMGPMGSGGYSIRKVGRIGEFEVLFCTELDRAPASTSPVFVGEGVVFAKSMAPLVQRVLVKSGVTAYCVRSEVELPEDISLYIQAHNNK